MREGSAKLLGGEVLPKGAAKAPKGWIFVRDAAYDELYVNREENPRMLRVVNKEVQLAGYDEPRVKIAFYSETTREWLEIHVSERYLVSSEPAEIDRLGKEHPTRVPDKGVEKDRKGRMRVTVKETKKAVSARKEAKAAVVEHLKHDGKRAFLATLGETKWLLDAGDAAKVAEIGKAGPQAAATKAKVKVVPRSEAAKGAAKKYEKMWAEAKR